MLAGVDPIQVALVVVVASVAAYVWAIDGYGRWYPVLSERFIYGVPWGTVISVVGVFAVYLFAQSGLSHWSSPAITPFRSWSYSYLLGLFSAGFAHAGPDHLIGNMTGTIVLAPLVEYAWSHYPPKLRDDADASEYPPPGDVVEPQTGIVGWGRPDNPGLFQRPWVRALVVFPAAVFFVSILTSVLALGWSLGFSGTVFAFGGFAVIYFPLASIVATGGFLGVSTVISALREPVLRVSTEPGGPGPPSWAGINVQAHLLGFLVGVMLAFALLEYRNERRSAAMTFLAVAIFGFVQRLWLLSLGGDGEYALYRGIGTIFVLVLTVYITATVTDEEVSFSGPQALVPWDASKRALALLWLLFVAAVTIILIGVEVAFGTIGFWPLVGVVLLGVLLLLPSLPTVAPNATRSAPLRTRHVLLVGLLAVTVLVALPSVVFNLPGMDEDPVPDTGTVEVEDYVVTYAEDATHGRSEINQSGVIVISEERDIWSTAVEKDRLAHNGEAEVVVGGVGWRESITANRTGWAVTGGDTAYVVDLDHNGERTRAFASDPVEADVTIANQTVSVEPGEETFSLNVTSDGEWVGTIPVPAANESATVGRLSFHTEPDDDTIAVYAEQDGTRVQIASREEF